MLVKCKRERENLEIWFCKKEEKNMYVERWSGDKVEWEIEIVKIEGNATFEIRVKNESKPKYSRPVLSKFQDYGTGVFPSTENVTKSRH